MLSRSFQVSFTEAKIDIAANPLRSGSRKKTKEFIFAVRHLSIEFDIDGEARLTSIRASDALSTPIAFISTSPGKYQVTWRIDSATFALQEGTLKLVSIPFGRDPVCTDLNQIPLLRGFPNCKYDPAYPVTVEYPGDSTWNSNDFRLDILAADAIPPSRSITSGKHPDNHTNSERDWVWILNELAHGKDATKVTRKLASRRADKPNPLHYAQRTVDVASARLRLIEGMPLDEVVTLHEVRSCKEGKCHYSKST